MKSFRIFPPEEILETTVTLPASKSIGVRALILNWLAGEKPVGSTCSDTGVTAEILAGGLPADGSELNVADAGTAMRFLTALCAASEGCRCTLRGTERMHHRPIGPLVHVLRLLGADIEYLGEEGFPPLRIIGHKLSGGTVDIDASDSSQYVSALMLIAPLLDAPLNIRLLGDAHATPYIRMTAEMMRRRGAEVDFERDKVEISCPRPLKAISDAEPDWSAAAFWYEIAALTAGWVTITGLSEDSIQGDKAISALFERLGVLTEFTEDGAELSATPDLWSNLDADLSDIPDAAPSLVVTCCLAGIPFRLTGVGSLRHKECDRLAALTEEMAKIGCLLETEAYGTCLTWDGRRVPVRELPVFDAHADHRMAMALAPVAVFVPGIVIEDVEVVGKSYPAFWQDLEAAGFTLADPSEPLPQAEE